MSNPLSRMTIRLPNSHPVDFSFDGEQWISRSIALWRRIIRQLSSTSSTLLAQPFFRDINETYALPLGYPMIDALSLRVLWIHGGILGLLLMLNAYTGIPGIFPSPLGWRIITVPESVAVLFFGLVALSVPLLVRTSTRNHYLWRLALTGSLAIFTYLFIFVSGGTVTMYFHMVLVMAYVALYADWRLEWLLLGVYAVASLLLDAIIPQAIYAFGHSVLSVPLHIVFLFVMAYFATVLSRNHRRSVDDLVEAKRRNDQFLAIASHELRTPLTSMKGYAEVLERRLKRTSQTELLSYATKMDDQLSKMTNLIRDLLDVSKIQSGQVVLRWERLSVNGLVEQAIEDVQALTHHHKLIVSGWANSPVMGDRVRLSQVLVNLLSNAMKYSPTSEKVMIRVSEARDRIIISVQDFGIGIPSTERDQVFEPYFRSQNAQREDVPGGLGMGLYISAEIVHRHGGKIWLDSEEGVGTTFSFMLPTAKDLPRQNQAAGKGATNA